jgi:DNA end-binding protein Ku
MASKKSTPASAVPPAVPAPRAIGSGIISFGLVTCPVKLYTGTSSHDLQFNGLHAQCTARVKSAGYVCSACGESVTPDAKGYEYRKGQYAVFTADELKAFEEATDNAIEILAFVPTAQVDPLYFEKSTLLGPDTGAQKAYRLLCAAMEQTQQAAIATFATRGRDKLVMLRAVGGGLLMHALYYADEVRSFTGLDLGAGSDVRAGEIELACRLIDELAETTFDPATYSDAYRARLLTAIEQKAAGQAVTIPTARAAAAPVVDMLAALQASLGRKKARQAA